MKLIGSSSYKELENENKHTQTNDCGSSKWGSGFSFSQEKLVGEENTHTSVHTLDLPVQRNPVSNVIVKEQCSSSLKAFSQLYRQ